MDLLTKLIDKEGSSLQLPPRVYEDRACGVYKDKCWIYDFSLKEKSISFIYEDGRIKVFDLDKAQIFTKDLKQYSDDPEYFFNFF